MVRYQNPIAKGMCPDPSVVRVGDTFYMENSTFEYFPGIRLAKSKDLIHWQDLPSVIQTKNQADLSQANSNEGIFAVCIRYHQGYFYVITTNFAEWKNFIIRGRLDESQQKIIWEDSRVVIDIMGIDPDLFFEDEQFYVQFTGFTKNGQKAIQQVQIEIETGEILRGPEILSFGTGGRDVEGPHIIKHHGQYYLLMAEGGTGAGHMITMQKSEHLWGPYHAALEVNPLFTNRDRAEEPLQNIGHADLFQDEKENWWMVCLGTRPFTHEHIQFTNLGRETLLYPVLWEEEWPTIYQGVPTLEVDLANFPQHQALIQEAHPVAEAFVETFSPGQLAPQWLSLRESLAERMTLSNHQLLLKGSATNLSQTSSPSFLALRQTEHQQELTVEINPAMCQIKDGAIGVACCIDTQHYAAIMVKQTPDGFVSYRIQKVLDIEIEEAIAQLTTIPQKFGISHRPTEKEFYLEDERQGRISFTTSAIHFSNEAVCALNTGDMQGIYCLGENAQISVTKVTVQ